MDELQRRAWTALDLGPLWVLRRPLPTEGSTAEFVEAATEDLGNRLPGPDTAAPAVELASAGPQDRASHVPPQASSTSTGGGLAEARPREHAVFPPTDWPGLREAVAQCTRCGLCRTRTQPVFGVGDPSARWMFVGEAPGAEEDARGEPFVGQAGKLLDAMLAAIGVGRQADVFIANVLKCRPPNNRNPEPDEVAQCEPYLKRQVELVSPRVIVAMGRFAVQSLLRTDASIASLRGRVHRYQVVDREVPLVVTYHPAYLLRNLPDKSKVWSDLCLAMDCVASGG